MSTTYSVLPGDTFETIARKVYGAASNAALIAAANPGAVEPLAAGALLSIPTEPSPASRGNRAAGVSEVSLYLGGRRFRYWEKIRLERAVDSIAVAEFSAPFEPDNAGFRSAFRPFSYKSVHVFTGDALLFTGTAVSIDPVLETSRRTVGVGCYSLPGVLEDCTPSASAYPVEFNDLKLPAIASALAAPFGVPVVFAADAGAAFDRVAVEPGKKILEFLAGLAKQRALVLSSTAEGALLFHASAPAGSAVAVLREGASPVVSINPFFSPQEFYSHVTGIESVFLGIPGSLFTEKNPHLAGVVRPFAFTVPDTPDADVEKAVAAKIGRMFGNVVSYTVALDTWRDPAGALWAPNTTVKLLAPSAMVYREYEFLVRSVVLERDGERETATLELTIPGAFRGEVPEVLPWDE